MQTIGANHDIQQQPLNIVDNNQDNNQEVAGHSVIFAGVSSFVITILTGWAFYYLSTTEETYGGPGCQELRSDSLVFGSILLIGGALGILCMGYYLMQGMSKDNILKAGYWGNFINLILGYFSFIYTIIITIDYFENEPCGTLRIFEAVMLIIDCVTLILGCCICCGQYALASQNSS